MLMFQICNIYLLLITVVFYIPVSKPWKSPPIEKEKEKDKKKRKLDVKEVFNNDDEDDSNFGAVKNRKLVPLGKLYEEK